MIRVLTTTWALLLGMLLLMLGNGVQGTLLGIRGEIEQFSTLELSIVMSAYFAGFLIGSRMAPEMIRRVGHIRVFAALGSFVSATLILFPILTDPLSWTLGRLLIGFCFSGIYVTAESWLNNSVDNENRGKALSLYLIVQMAGIVAAQGLLTLGDPGGFVLFIIPSVLVSISFAPILLNVQPTPAFDTTKPMSLRRLFEVSPLGCVGTGLLGGIFSALFAMSAVFGSRVGLSVPQISTFVAAIYLGGLLAQYPIGWVSDRMDRRLLILFVSAVGAAAAFIVMFFLGSFAALLIASFVIGSVANPLYGLLLAYTNDFLESDDMAAASGGLIFINGIGAVSGPLVTGWLMGAVGPAGYFLFLGVLLSLLAAYALYRTTQRPSVPVDETGSYAPLSPTATPVVVEAAQEFFIDAAIDQENEGTTSTQDGP